MLSGKKYFIHAVIISIVIFSSCKKESMVETRVKDVQTDTIPSAPTNLQIISMTENDVKLRWSDNSTFETSFVIEQSTDTTNFVIVQSVDANIDSSTITATFLTTKTYYFRLRAKNGSYISSTSNIVWRTLFPPPTNMTISTFSSGLVSLNWIDNSTDETGFVIEQKIDAFSYSIIDSTGENITSKSISGIFDSSKTYSFRIFAKNFKNRSAYSNAAARTLGFWVFVAGGTFAMGRNGEFRDERPVHDVTLTNYSISKFEVTVKEFRKFTIATNHTFPTTPSWGWNDDGPIVNVSWDDANNYCAWLDSTTGTTIRLPTEAEWEYAARGGENSEHYFYSGSNEIGTVAWYFLNANGHTFPCGLKKPNELGIYDMSGNAWEWCADWQGSYPFSSQKNPTGPSGGSNKIFRGGSWFDYGLYDAECRVETRYAYTPHRSVEDGGFRIVKEQ